MSKKPKNKSSKLRNKISKLIKLKILRTRVQKANHKTKQLYHSRRMATKMTKKM